MSLQQTAPPNLAPALLDAIAALPLRRDGSHRGPPSAATPRAFYRKPPACGKSVKVRAFAAVPEVEDVFDAVFAWMSQPGAAELVRRRQQQIADD